VLSLPKKETTAADAARRHGLKVAEVAEWWERFLLGAENALRARPKERLFCSLGKRATNSTRSRDLGRWQMADEQHSEEVQRWTAMRRSALVLSLLKGETTAADAARRHGLKVAEVEEWRERFLLGAEKALRARPK
jgi:hypothetical protein